jgi:hypothetical protein
MFTLLIILHLLAMATAMGGGFANIIAKRQMAKADPVTFPGMAMAAGAVGKLSSSALVVLWITGIWMTSLKYGLANMTALFWIKITVVGALTLVVISLNLMMIRAKKSGTPPDSAKADKHAYTISILGILTVAIAVILFR